MEPLYPWYQLAADIALTYKLTEDRELAMATEVNRAIQTKKIQCWSVNGDPIRGAVPLQNLRNPIPHLTVTEGNAWLKGNGYLQEWAPAEKKHTQNGTAIRWIESEMERLYAYRQTHTELQTAAYFGVSGPRVREILGKLKKQSATHKRTIFSGLGKR